MTAGERHERFIHPTRLGWDLHGPGVRTSPVLSATGQPILEIRSRAGTLARITVVRRCRGWAFIRRPWWARERLAGRVAAPALDDVLLLPSEPVTNAVTHSDSGRSADGRMTVYVARLPGAVHVEVTDDGSAAHAPEPDDEGGRGLWLVDLVATAWGSHHDDEAGGSVWFRVTE
ncbi:hypothetical protein GCM10010517_40730 [Streptosporangium fragile]|uniref:Histidine kinase/HSP90-like ATPase domain-containing protein n=1 Tax=Streptosporangium fragile TaxID=46186 RepID=A0ABN3W0T4_9ACTN